MKKILFPLRSIYLNMGKEERGEERGRGRKEMWDKGKQKIRQKGSSNPPSPFYARGKISKPPFSPFSPPSFSFVRPYLILSPLPPTYFLGGALCAFSPHQLHEWVFMHIQSRKGRGGKKKDSKMGRRRRRRAVYTFA